MADIKWKKLNLKNIKLTVDGTGTALKSKLLHLRDSDITKPNWELGPDDVILVYEGKGDVTGYIHDINGRTFFSSEAGENLKNVTEYCIADL